MRRSRNRAFGPGGLQAFLQRPVLGGEFADALVDGGVVGAEASDRAAACAGAFDGGADLLAGGFA
jgi:hypothetical protein